MNILILFFGWLVIYYGFLSPKARIRRLWKEIYNLPIKLGRMKQQTPERAAYLKKICLERIEQRYKMIEALLDYNFDPEEHKEYIAKNHERLESNKWADYRLLEEIFA